MSIEDRPKCWRFNSALNRKGFFERLVKIFFTNMGYIRILSYLLGNLIYICIVLSSVATFGKRMSKGFGGYIRVSSLVGNLM